MREVVGGEFGVSFISLELGVAIILRMSVLSTQGPNRVEVCQNRPLGCVLEGCRNMLFPFHTTAFPSRTSSASRG